MLLSCDSSFLLCCNLMSFDPNYPSRNSEQCEIQRSRAYFHALLRDLLNDPVENSSLFCNDHAAVVLDSKMTKCRSVMKGPLRCETRIY